MRMSRIAIVIAVTALLAGSVAASAGEIIRHRFDNGLTVLLAPNSWNRIVSVSVMIDAGSKHDPPGQYGLAYLTSQMLLAGTKMTTGPELAHLIDGTGAEVGTEAREDFAEVHATVTDVHFDEALAVIAEALVHPTFDRAALLDEQRKAQALIERELDDSFTRAYRKLNSLRFGRHPYAHPPVGTEDGIASVSRDDIQRLYQARYAGESTVISIVGSFDPDATLRRIERLFAEYPSHPVADPRLPDVDAPAKDYLELYRAAKQGYIVRSFVGPALGSDDYSAVRVLCGVLGDGTGSRLYSSLGPSGAGLAGAVGSHAGGLFEGGWILIYAASGKVDLSLGIIERIIEEIRTEPVSREEVDRAKNRLKGRAAIEGQTNLTRARWMARSELAGLGHDFIETHMKRIDRVDADDVLRVAEKYLVDPATVVLRPGTKKKSGI